MKQTIVCVMLLVVFAVPSFAGLITVSGRTGLYSPSGGGANASIMYGISAYYPLNDSWSLRGAVETTTYLENGQQVNYTPITVDLIYSQRLGMGLRSYAGAGLSYNNTSSAGVSNMTTGAQAEVGLAFDLAGMSAGIEYRYLIPDLKNSNSGSSNYNAYATASLTQSFNF